MADVNLFNIPANQTQVEPVSAFLKGRAMRMAYDQDKARVQFLQMQMAELPKQREHERQIEAAETAMKMRTQQVTEQKERFTAIRDQLLAVERSPDPVQGAMEMGQAIGAGGRVAPGTDPKQVRSRIRSARMRVEAMAGLSPVPEEPSKPAGVHTFSADQGLYTTDSSGSLRVLREPVQDAGSAPVDPFSQPELIKRYGRPPDGYRMTADGKAERIAGIPDKPPTESERRYGAFVASMSNAAGTLAQIEQRLPDMRLTAMDAYAFAQTMASVHGVVDVGKRAALNKYLSSDKQQYYQAVKEWADPLVRMRTGAALRAEEFPIIISTYFPEPGDTDEVIMRKRRARAVAENGMRIAAGRGGAQNWKELSGLAARDRPGLTEADLQAMQTELESLAGEVGDRVHKEGDQRRSKKTGVTEVYRGGQWVRQ